MINDIIMPLLDDRDSKGNHHSGEKKKRRRRSSLGRIINDPDDYILTMYSENGNLRIHVDEKPNKEDKHG